MEEKLIFEHSGPDILVTTERIVVGGKTIPASTAECAAVYSSTGVIFKNNEFYVAYPRGDNTYRQGRRIDYCMTLKYPPSERAKMLSEYDVSLLLVTKTLAKDQMKKLKEEINQAIKKAAAWQQVAADSQAQSEIAAMKKLDSI